MRQRLPKGLLVFLGLLFSMSQTVIIANNI